MRWLAALSVLALAGSYLAAQIDYLRRHEPGVSPSRYLLPQLTRIWIPGVAAALVLGIIALVMHRRARKTAGRSDQAADEATLARGSEHG